MKNFHSIPDPAPTDIIAWAERIGLKVDGHSFDSSRVPQLIEPIRAMTDTRTRTGTLFKPVQSGGSTAAEVVAAFWAAFYNGLIQYNWNNDGKAKWRWNTRILKMLESCKDIRWAGGPYDRTSCKADMINTTMLVQGIEADGALDSETVPLQINEEVHLWSPGQLDKARRRQTLVWNAKAFDVSNAGNVGDQLDLAFQDGSMETWEVFCPGCKSFHFMRFRWDSRRPELGGLRFDTSAGRRSASERRYNMSEIVRTIRYQMPCGFPVRDVPKERRLLRGQYKQLNAGALSHKRSWTYEGVSVTEINWTDLVSEWLTAVRAIKGGDEDPMRRFTQERECRPWSRELIPFSGHVIVNKTLTKSRAGLPNKILRAWFADKQKGFAHKGDFMHFFLVIRDFDEDANSLLVYEGRCETEADVQARLIEHGCYPNAGAVDCTWDTAQVKQFCFRIGCNAQTTSNQEKLFYHPDEKVYKIHSKPEGLHKQMGIPPKHSYSSSVKGNSLVYHPHPSEPMHWNIHQIGHLKLLNFLRSHEEVVKRNGGTDFIKWEVPGDVSEDYLKQIDSWEFSTKQKNGTNEEIEVCRQRFKDDHYLFCEAGIANIVSMAPHPKFPNYSILAVRIARLGLTEAVIGTKAEEKK